MKEAKGITGVVVMGMLLEERVSEHMHQAHPSQGLRRPNY